MAETLHSVPKKCVILFEDIDAANIVREKSMLQSEKGSKKPSISDGETEQQLDDSKSDKDDSGSNLEMKGTQQPPKKKKKQTEVTLSGLLNAVDGSRSPSIRSPPPLRR
jgi:chaperone BCS1